MNDDRAIQTAASLLRARAQGPEVKKRRDASWMLALADWLESWAGVEVDLNAAYSDDYKHALTVARAYLGDRR